MKLIFRIAMILVIVNLNFSSIGYAQDTSSEEEKVYLEQKRIADSLYANHQFDEAIPLYEKLLAESSTRSWLFEPLTKSYAYLGMFEKAEERTNELYLPMASSDYEKPDLYRLSLHCRYALFKTMQQDYKASLAHVDSMLVYSDPKDIYPGGPTCAVRFETRAGAYERAAANYDLLLKNTSGIDQAQFLNWAIYTARQLGQSEMEKALMQQALGVKQIIDSGGLQISGSLASQGITEKDIYLWLAELYALQGETEKAVESLEQAHEAGHLGYYRWKNEVPMFDVLKDDPSFNELMANMEQDVRDMRERLNEEMQRQ